MDFQLAVAECRIGTEIPPEREYRVKRALEGELLDGPLPGHLPQ